MSNQANRPPYVKDASLSLVGGVNVAVPPHVIGKDQCQYARNATMRGGRAKPRPGYRKRDLTFSSTSQETAFETARFQRASFYDGNGIPSIMAAIGGRMFKVDISTYKVSEITPQIATTTTTTADFVIPAADGATTVSVSVASTAGMDTDLAGVTIGTYALSIAAITDATTITVTNEIAANVGTNVVAPATVTFWKFQTNSTVKEIGWTRQAENYWIYQDNESLPVIFDGTSSRRSVPSQNEIPVGNVMGYAHGRLIVALPDRVSYRIGDIVFGSSGTAANHYRDAILKFTETGYLSEGGDQVAKVFGANSTSGTINSITPIAMTNTALGQGPVMIGQSKMVFTIQLPFDRTTWTTLPSPLQTASPINGPLSQESTINVNSDLWYRAIDGIRSYVMATRDAISSWTTTPMSGEIYDVLADDTEHLLEWSSAVLFDNRLLMTISPVRDAAHGIYHRGLAVMDFNMVSTVRGKASPAWEGIWTGLRILQIISGIIDHKERCFIIALNDSGELELWEIDPALKTDNDTDRITWSLDLRSMDCQNIEQFKSLQTGRIILRNLNDELDWTATYRSDQAPCYQAWDSGEVCALIEDCADPACAGPANYREQQRSNIRLKLPPDGHDAQSGWKYRTGYQFQTRLSFTGYAELESFILYACDEPEGLHFESIV